MALRDEMCENIFDISPLAFYQVNKKQAEKLYDKALEYADLKNNDTVLDLYCGIGTITLHMAKKAEKAYGIEIVPEAIENAKENAALNGVSNVEFYCNDAVNGANMLIKEGIKPTVICVDPPRKGLDEESINAVLKLSPNRIVYVSCDCGTLARDVKILCSKGYRAEKMAAYDMFPRTRHVANSISEFTFVAILNEMLTFKT